MQMCSHETIIISGLTKFCVIFVPYVLVPMTGLEENFREIIRIRIVDLIL